MQHIPMVFHTISDFNVDNLFLTGPSLCTNSNYIIEYMYLLLGVFDSWTFMGVWTFPPYHLSL